MRGFISPGSSFSIPNTGIAPDTFSRTKVSCMSASVVKQEVTEKEYWLSGVAPAPTYWECQDLFLDPIGLTLLAYHTMVLVSPRNLLSHYCNLYNIIVQPQNIMYIYIYIIKYNMLYIYIRYVIIYIVLYVNNFICVYHNYAVTELLTAVILQVGAGRFSDSTAVHRLL